MFLSIQLQIRMHNSMAPRIQINSKDYCNAISATAAAAYKHNNLQGNNLNTRYLQRFFPNLFEFNSFFGLVSNLHLVTRFLIYYLSQRNLVSSQCVARAVCSILSKYAFDKQSKVYSQFIWKWINEQTNKQFCMKSDCNGKKEPHKHVWNATI